MLTCPNPSCKKQLPALTRTCRFCQSDLSLLVEYADHLQGALGRAESRFPGYPALAGQHFDYLRQQLELWRAGVRGGTFGPIMTAAVRNITDEQIRAVALYYSQLPP